MTKLLLIETLNKTKSSVNLRSVPETKLVVGFLLPVIAEGQCNFFVDLVALSKTVNWISLFDQYYGHSSSSKSGDLCRIGR